MEPRRDCRHYRGDRPCEPAKRAGTSCADCGLFAPRGGRAVILKLGSIGDVLRTSFLPAALQAAAPGTAVEWMTDRSALPLFEGHPDVAEAVPFDALALARLMAEPRDLLVNLEVAQGAAAAATLARAARKMGFGLDDRGAIVPFNPECGRFHAMCLDDRLKRANGQSYQSHVLAMCGLPGPPAPPFYRARPEETDLGRSALAAAGVAGGRPLVGLNLGSGRRWLSKRWPLWRFLELADLLREGGAEPIGLAGPDEEDLAARAVAGGLPVAGPGLPLRVFAGTVGLCDVVVTGDTFALHLAVALGRRVVALFGPTSAAEVELFGQGEKIEPERPCRCYYRAACADPDPCLATIGAERVRRAALDLIHRSGPDR